MAQLCLCLTGSTLAENLRALDMYRGRIDLAELRADCLDPNEVFHIRSFPELAGIPTILSVRRRADGGYFDDGEGARLVVFAKGLAFASRDRRLNFAYVDIEQDFRIPALEEAARTFGTRIIRSRYCPAGLPEDLDEIWTDLSRDPYEIPKLAAVLRGIGETRRLFEFADRLPDTEHIVSGMGEYGFCFRILTSRTGSLINYASPSLAGLPSAAPGQATAEEYENVYRWRKIRKDYSVFGILGGPSVLGSLSPSLHNAGYAELGMPAVYLPFPSDSLEQFLALAEELGVRGFSVTVPFKEKILPYLTERAPEVSAIGACNTVVRTPSGWYGTNTDAAGFERSVLDFLKRPDLKGVRTAIIGAGGSARAVAYALQKLGASACVVNRGMNKAKQLAERHGFEWAGMNERAVELLGRYNDLIVQTTSVGMEGGVPGDPLEWYEFTGSEALVDIIYNPKETPVMRRAREAGCAVANGLGMLRAQGEVQFELFTGKKYPGLPFGDVV
ncbi:MAG TPA: type I 3-dehydroquinate dehydratase [Spirochaetia bacterium]|nr:type I 3-dehydroquinate dehydratase [Spirochaetales bacterium]HRY78828.1 type I 3-dehydroquinate dehydratase [Spirochaetia bacterium]